MAALGRGRLASADPDSVPAGLYARAALTKLGVWDEVAPHLARAENVRAALAYVARGETTAGHRVSDRRAGGQACARGGCSPADTHPPIVYPAAVTALGRPRPACYSTSCAVKSARQVFVRYGFTVAP